MTQPIDQEIKAIKTLLGVLQPLEPNVRSSVLAYVLGRLNIRLMDHTEDGTAAALAERRAAAIDQLPKPPATQTPIHIKQLKESKKPKSANEMSALVGYYLSSIAPTSDRKATINTKDIETYFKIAEFPLPKEIKMTLANAKNAGYLDSVGDGEYKLNAIGHNLVVHSMPRGAGGVKSGRRRKAGNKRRVHKRPR